MEVDENAIINEEKSELVDENLSAEPESNCSSNNQEVAPSDAVKLENNENTSIEPELNPQQDQENGENGGSDVNLDPYAYLNRPEFCSENFKIEIMNLPKYYGAGVRFLNCMFISWNLCLE